MNIVVSWVIDPEAPHRSPQFMPLLAAATLTSPTA
jgi:hypothetical protein